MKYEEFEKLFWAIQELFNEHAGCLDDGCHCSGDATKFHDELLKVLYAAIIPEKKIP